MPKRILIVDDEAETLRALEGSLRMFGHPPVPAASGEAAIPLAGRIVADVSDAPTSERPCKKAPGLEEVTGMLMDGRGGHFDAKVLGIFYRHRHAFHSVMSRYRTNGAPGEGER